MLSKNVPFWSVLAHIFETSGWSNVTFGWASAGRPFSFSLKTLGEKVGYCQSLSSNFVLLGASYVFIDECNPAKIFKMASNSFEVTDVPF